jgi:hypothetical protein
MKETRKKIRQETDLIYLNQLEEKENIKQIYLYNQTIYDIFINLKNTINDIVRELFDDIINFKFNIDIFFKNDRLFYIGLIFIIIAILLLLLNLLFNKS